ncbi:hypothetical protein BpHYR1_009504 [Brachionus plicatilis]|uniref:Uncharacterized protein n=1 Tax=Brachionus plicatilis TaxID=10195 RepID=A0A3M7STX3_BRAPC|nr:hypothetical protein BpHYR1_009504 [Brachionus plicatilis]
MARIVSYMVSVQPSLLIQLNLVFLAFIKRSKITWSKVSNFLYSFEPMKQNSCMLTHDVMISKHIVNIMSDPSFFPGPNI